jgi:hypothetical protein
MPYIYSLPIAEEFDQPPFRILIRVYSYDIIPGKTSTTYYATYRRKSARYREHGWSKEFSNIAECRAWICRQLDEQHARTLEQSRETRTRRLEQKIAQITRDFLLGKHIGNQSECSICGRKLSDPPSIERAIGSECWPRLQDRLAKEVPRCEETIAHLRTRLADLEKQDYGYWAAQYAGFRANPDPKFKFQWVAWKLEETAGSLAGTKRDIADAERLLAAARKWKATDERNA